MPFVTTTARAFRRSVWSGTIILLLAAYLRLAAFHEALVGADQSSILAAAANIAAFRSLPLVGIKSSIGVMQTAVAPYLAALPLFFVPKVVAVKWFFSVLDLLALALLFNAVKRVWGSRAATVTALLYAANPWVVEFIRWIWYQTLIPTFATTTFAALLIVLTTRNRRTGQAMVVVGLLGATLMGLVHLAAAPWAALLGLLGIWLAWRKGWRAALFLGLSLSALAAYPYTRYLLQTNFADVGLILHGSADAAPTWNWATYRLSWELLTGAHVLETPRDPLWAASVLPLQGLQRLLTIILAMATANGLYEMRRAHPRRKALILTLIWTGLAPTLFLRTTIHLQHFYLLFIFPAPYVLIGAWVGSLGDALHVRHGGLRWLGYGTLVALLLLSLGWTHWWSVRIAYESRGRLRAATRAWLMDEMVGDIWQVLRANPAQQGIVLTTFEGGDLSPFDWMRNFVHDDRLRIAPSGQGMIIPAGPTCYWLAPGATAADIAPVAATATLSPALTIPATPPWPAYCTPARAPLPTPLAKWQNGLSLLDKQVVNELTPGGALDLTYTWHYRAIAPQEYHLFNHLMRAETLVAQVDGVGVPPWYWRDDDVLITHFSLPLPTDLPPGDYRLTLGTYTWPAITPVLLIGNAPEYVIQTWSRE